MYSKTFLNGVVYIFFGLTILGINKTPKTKSNNGAIITKKDSTFINSKIIFFKCRRIYIINK